MDLEKHNPDFGAHPDPGPQPSRDAVEVFRKWLHSSSSLRKMRQDKKNTFMTNLCRIPESCKQHDYVFLPCG